MSSYRTLAARLAPWRRVSSGLLTPPSDRILFWMLFTISCLLSLASMDHSSYFLHWDVASQDMAALDLLKGCWGYDAGKPLIMLLLSVPFGLVGANPVLESTLLALLAGMSAGWLYALARHALVGRAWALVASLWFMSWPATVYYNRTHLGYPLALLLAGLVCSTRQKYFLSGLVLGLAILAHAGLLIPVITWIGVLWFVSKDRGLAKPGMAILGLGFALLSLEAVRFLYTGERFGWWFGQLADIQAYAGSDVNQLWSHVLEAFWLVNGPLHSTICLVGLVGFALTNPAKRSGFVHASFLTGVLVLIFYVLRTAVGLGGFNTRLLVGVTPLMAIAAVGGYSKMVDWIGWQLPRLVSASLAALVLGAMLSDVFVEARQLSRTPYPFLEQAFVRAKTLGVPVRYFGQPYPALFFGLKHNVETLANWSDLESITLDVVPSVVAIEAQSIADSERLSGLVGEGVAKDYHRLVYPNPAASNRIRAIEEEFFPSTDLLRSIVAAEDDLQPVMVIWIPRYPSSTESSSPAYTGVVSYQWLAYYYHGDGDCQIVPRGHPYAYRYYRYIFSRLLQVIGRGI